MSARLGERIRSLGQIANVISAGGKLTEVLELLVMAVCQRSAWSSSAVMVADEATGQSTLLARYDPLFRDAPGSVDRWPLATSPIPAVLRDGRPIVIKDAQADRAFPGYRREALERDYHVVVVLPFAAKDELGRGLVLSVHAHEPRTVSEDDIAFLETVALLGSLAVERARGIRQNEAQLTQLRTALEMSRAAMEQVLSAEELDPFMALAARQLNRPFMVLDLTGNRLALGPGAELPANIETRDAIRALKKRLGESKAGDFDLAEPLTWDEANPRSRQTLIAEPCVAGDVLLGGLILPVDAPLAAVAALAAQQLRAALTVLLLRRHIRLEAQAETHGAFFARLFSADWRDTEAMLARAHHLGLPLDKPARLAAFRLPPTRSAERQAAGIRIEHSIAREIKLQLPAGATFRDGDTIVLFLPEGRGGRARSHKVIEHLLRSIEWLDPSPPVVGLSQPCERLPDYPKARRELDMLLDLAEKSERSGVVESEEFGPLSRLIAHTGPASLRDFVETTIGDILRHDREHDADFLITLENFLAHRSRLAETAEALGIHVSTLRYRLQRLADLFGIELDDPETRVGLELALRIHRQLGSSQPAFPAGPEKAC
ncbi:MAG TPA: helix-turn-helix domain-containing protein [Stellaceae bacterium]|nr:helix-turn-helix domain-containing protein [Stellaceae bacterium]